MWEFFGAVMEVEKYSSTHRKYYQDLIPASFVASHRIYQSGLLSSWYLQRTSKVKHWVLFTSSTWFWNPTKGTSEPRIHHESMEHCLFGNGWTEKFNLPRWKPFEHRHTILGVAENSDMVTWRCFLYSSNVGVRYIKSLHISVYFHVFKVFKDGYPMVTG